MKNEHSHLILYAKNWYKRTDVIEDIKQIISVRCGIDKEFISNGNVVDYVSEVVFPFIKTDGGFSHFLARIFNGHCYFGLNPSNTTSIEIVLKELLSILSIVQVKEGDKILIDLDKPDYSILPRKVYPK